MSRTVIIALSAALLAGCTVPKDPPGFPMTGEPPAINQVTCLM